MLSYSTRTKHVTASAHKKTAAHPVPDRAASPFPILANKFLPRLRSVPVSAAHDLAGTEDMTEQFEVFNLVFFEVYASRLRFLPYSPESSSGEVYMVLQTVLVSVEGTFGVSGGNMHCNDCGAESYNVKAASKAVDGLRDLLHASDGLLQTLRFNLLPSSPLHSLFVADLVSGTAIDATSVYSS